MNNTRLDNVLRRNRRGLVLDFAAATFLLVALVFSSLALGAKLPALSSAARAPAGESAASLADGALAAASADRPTRIVCP